MTATHIQIALERSPLGPYVANISGRVTVEYRRFFIEDFESDIELRPMEREIAEEKLIEHFRSYDKEYYQDRGDPHDDE